MNVEQLKRDAKRMKKALGITHSEALDCVAKTLGFKNWSLFMKHERKVNGNDNA